MKLKKDFHDLNLSKWGPYSKKYAGISHIANEEEGIRFDLSVFPAFYRRKIELPTCRFESNYNIWEASTDLSYFSTRHQLEWKDEVYTDIAYSKYDDNSYIISANCVNNTEYIQNIAMHFMLYLQYHAVDNMVFEPISYDLPNKSDIIMAIDFDKAVHKQIRPKDSLVTDGLRLGEVRCNGFNRGSGVKLGEANGDSVNYTMKLKNSYISPVLCIRCKSEENSIITVSGDIETEISAFKNKEITVCYSSIPRVNKDEIKFTLQSDKLLVIDSIIICEKEEIENIHIKSKGLSYTPKVWECGSEEEFHFDNTQKTLYDTKVLAEKENILILKYRDTDYYYGICWDHADFDIRYFFSDNLDTYMKFMAHDHVKKVLIDNDGKTSYANIFLRPIDIKPCSSKKIYGAVCSGKSKDEVRDKLLHILKNTEIMEETYEKRHKEVCKIENQDYALSQNIMKATTLSNVVYPIYAKGKYIRHNTPGKWWDTLYTWDSGFCGLGLSTMDLQRAVDCLNAYLTEEGDKENAFIHHGTPIPVQFYLFQEVFNKLQSKEVLEFFYPKLKQYYLFLIGELGSSDMADFDWGMLKTWSYFYNSAGWDDYPPQVEVRYNNLTDKVSCVSNTSHAIRCSKMLKHFAYLMNENHEDIKKYENDIEKLTNAVQTNAWDSESGYFSYLINNNGKCEIFRHENGENYNKGLDGTSPMIAGILNTKQREEIVSKLMDRKHFLTDIGLSTVDQSASYYRKDGYWNGAVWFPHQWFYTKAFLDYGYGEEAYKIAKIGLDIWEKEVSSSYCCFEHFIINSQRGAGWHHFSGLSTPVLLWHETYFKKASVSCGFSAIITYKNVENNNLNCKISFGETRENTTVVIVKPSSGDYILKVNGESKDFKIRFENAVEFNIATKAYEDVEICLLSVKNVV